MKRRPSRLPGRILMNNNRSSCQRCVNGQLMRFGDEVACINCGWRPAKVAPSPPTPPSSAAPLPPSRAILAP